MSDSIDLQEDARAGEIVLGCAGSTDVAEALGRAASPRLYLGMQAGRRRKAVSIQVKARDLGWASAHAMWRAAARRRGFKGEIAAPAEYGENNAPRPQIVTLTPCAELMAAFDALPSAFRRVVAESATGISIDACAIAANAGDREAAIDRMRAYDTEILRLGTLALYGPDHPQAPREAHIGKMLAAGFVDAADSMLAACQGLGLGPWDTLQIARDGVSA